MDVGALREILEVSMAAIIHSRSGLRDGLSNIWRLALLNLGRLVEVLLGRDKCDLVLGLIRRFGSAEAPGHFHAGLFAGACFEIVLGGFLALHGDVFV